MRFEREQVAVALVLGALAAGAVMPACVSDDSAAPTVDGGAPLPQPDSLTPLPGVDATVPGTDGGPPLVDGGSPPQEEASVPDADAGPAPALVRFAWFVGGTGASQGGPGGAEVKPRVPLDVDGGGPAYDVCIAPHGTGAWVGPLLAKSSFAAGLHPFDVTKYFQVVPGHYDARIISAGSTTCDLPDAGAPSGAEDGGADDAGEGGAVVDAGSPPSSDFTSLPPVVAGAAMTAVLVDPANPAASIADVFAFTDDTTTTAGKAKVRFVNVSESDVVTANDAGTLTDDAGVTAIDGGVTVTGADFGIGGGILLTSLFTNVTAHTQIDPAATNGYREIDPLSGVDSTLTTVSGQEAQYAPFATDALTLPAGGIFTAFYASEPGDGRQPVLVWCYDGQPSTTSALLTKCAHSDVTTDSSRSYTRFGNFSADGAERDVCVKYHSYGSYAGPLLAQSVDGGTAIPTQFLSAYFNLHGGFTFDARFVAAGAANCATAVAPDTTYQAFTGLGGGYTSLLLTGYAAVPDDAGTVPPYDAGPPPVFTDDAGDVLDAGPQPTSPSLATLATSVVVIEDVEYDANDYAALRLVHVAAIHPQPITVTVSSGPVIIKGDVARPQSSSPWTLGNAPYGGFSTLPGPTDPWGYVPMTTNVLTIDLEQSEWTYTIDGDQTSMFAFDGEGGVQLLACDDYDEFTFPGNSALYTSCCVVGTQNCGGNQVLPTFRPASRHRHHLVRALPTKR